MSTVHKTLVSGEIAYKIEGSLGSVLRSFENGVTEGEVRYICGSLLYAYNIGRRKFRKDVICWALVETPNNYDDVRKYINGL